VFFISQAKLAAAAKPQSVSIEEHPQRAAATASDKPCRKQLKIKFSIADVLTFSRFE